MIEGNTFVCSETGFSISKPDRWRFVPGPWLIPEREVLARTEEAAQLLRNASVPIVAFAHVHNSSSNMNPTVQVFRRPFNGEGSLDDLAVATQELLPRILTRCVFREVTTSAMLASHRALRYHVEYAIVGEPGVSFRCRMLGHSSVHNWNVFTITMATSTRKTYRFEREIQQVLNSVAFRQSLSGV